MGVERYEFQETGETEKEGSYVSYSDYEELEEELKECREWIKVIIDSEDLLDMGYKREFHERGKKLL